MSGLRSAGRFGERHEGPWDGCFPSRPEAKRLSARSRSAGLGGSPAYASPEAPRPGGGCPARSLRFAPGLTIGARMLPREELAVGHLFPILGRVRELDLFDLGVFGEEAFNGRRLHAWAMRARPTCAERDAPGRRGKRSGVRGVGEAGPRRKRGQRAKTQLERRAEGTPVSGTLWATRRRGGLSLCASQVTNSSRSGPGGMGLGLRNAASGSPRFRF